MACYFYSFSVSLQKYSFKLYNLFPELLEILGIHCNENNIQFFSYIMIHIHTYIHSYICIQIHMHTVHKTWYINISYAYTHKSSKQVTSTQSNKNIKLKQTNTINTLQIQRPKEIASELRRTSYKHTLWKLMYTIQDEHMLSSMDSKNIR